MFGWSYPAGCNGVPDDDYRFFCTNCGKEERDFEGGAGHTFEWEQGIEPEGDEVIFCSHKCRDEWHKNQKEA